MKRERFCGNPRCGDWIAQSRWIPLCRSCRFAGKCGLALAFVVAFGWRLLAPEWLTLTKAVLGWVFNR